MRRRCTYRGNAAPYGHRAAGYLGCAANQERASFRRSIRAGQAPPAPQTAGDVFVRPWSLLPPSKKNPCDPHTGATDSNACERIFTNMATNSRLMSRQRRVRGEVQCTAAGSRPRAADISDRIVFRIVRASARAVERSRLRETGKCASREHLSFGSVPEGRTTTLIVSPVIRTASLGGNSALP